MLLTLSPLLERYSERLPLPVMARALLERQFHGPTLDAWFEEVCDRQYTRELLFSSVFGLMSEVVFRQQPSVRSAYQSAREPLRVSLTAVCDKLTGIEAQTTEALVERSAQQSGELIEGLGGECTALLPGVEVRILDGNCLAGREHRLKETRARRAAPLPGKTLAVLDPARGRIRQVLVSEDGYSQERTLVGEIIDQAQAGELWIADRNFCTATVVFGLADRGAQSLIREHAQWHFVPLEGVGERVGIEGGWACEHRIETTEASTGRVIELRRVCVHLDEPTCDGDKEVYLWTTLPEQRATAAQVAELYRKRWLVETAFQKLTVELRCEVTSLGYPRAALFAFAVAVVVYNTLAVVWAAMRAAHGARVMDEQISTYYVANEMAKAAESLAIMVDAEEWALFTTLSAGAMSAWLLACAGAVELRKYRKAKTLSRPKRPPRPKDSEPHLSTARLLAERKR